MNTTPQRNMGQVPPRTSTETAAYLAAILPELAAIARTSDLKDLCAQIDRAAVLAHQALIRHRH